MNNTLLDLHDISVHYSRVVHVDLSTSDGDSNGLVGKCRVFLTVFHEIRVEWLIDDMEQSQLL